VRLFQTGCRINYIVGKGGVQMMQDKLATIRDWPTPKKGTDIKSSLGFANFYRKYVANLLREHNHPQL
jgi:hypothetical protein